MKWESKVKTTDAVLTYFPASSLRSTLIVGTLSVIFCTRSVMKLPFISFMWRNERPTMKAQTKRPITMAAVMQPEPVVSGYSPGALRL